MTKEQYEAVSRPFRGRPGAVKALKTLNRVLTLSCYLLYPALLAWGWALAGWLLTMNGQYLPPLGIVGIYMLLSTYFLAAPSFVLMLPLLPAVLRVALTFRSGIGQPSGDFESRSSRILAKPTTFNESSWVFQTGFPRI